MTLGLMRCNPFDLETRDVPWLGLSPSQPTTGPLIFETLLEGLRAGCKLFWTYEDRGWNTPEKALTEFAPSSENPTEQYIQNVCEWTGYERTQPLTFRELATWMVWAPAIIRQEQGPQNGITPAQLKAAFALAEDD